MDARFAVKCDHVVGVPAQMFILTTCPRCLGTGVYNAYSIGPDGKIVTVMGADKLAQQITKILVESRRPSGYGFDYGLLTGVIDQSSVTAVKSEVFRCMQFLKTSQTQEKLEGFSYIPSEEIDTVSALEAFVDSADPRRINVSVAVITKAGTTATVTNIPIRK